jgi:hypothetical protein
MTGPNGCPETSVGNYHRLLRSAPEKAPFTCFFVTGNEFISHSLQNSPLDIILDRLQRVQFFTRHSLISFSGLHPSAAICSNKNSV